MENEAFLINCGRVYNPNDWFYNPAYVVNRLYYIVRGTAVYKQDIPLKPGYLYFFAASPDFQVSQTPEDPVDHVYFDFLTCRNLLAEDYLEIDPSSQPKLKHLLNAIEEDYANPPHNETISKAYLEILIYYLRDYLIPEESYSEITATMLQMIHTAPVNELSVNRIAMDMNRNVNHIIRCFKKELGITPHRYIARLKLKLAIGYMRQGLSRTEIAEKLGFGSLSSFSYFLRQESEKA